MSLPFVSIAGFGRWPAAYSWRTATDILGIRVRGLLLVLILVLAVFGLKRFACAGSDPGGALRALCHSWWKADGTAGPSAVLAT